MVPQSDAADAEATEALAKVKLHSLKAVPGTIAPFAASEISWNVSGEGKFTVLLDSATVPRIGEKLVTPLTTRTFQLKARAGRIMEVLGKVTVTVDQSACFIAPIPNHAIETRIRADIDEILAMTGGASRQRPDIVIVDENGIRLDLAFFKVIPVYPKAEAYVQAHFRYRAVNSQIVEQFDRLDVDVSFKWYLWLMPWNHPGLYIAGAIAEDDLRLKVRKKAMGGAEALESFVPAGHRVLTAQHTLTNYEMLVCPDHALHKLLVAGAVIQGTTLTAEAREEGRVLEAPGAEGKPS
jgi:hypothetical protein